MTPSRARTNTSCDLERHDDADRLVEDSSAFRLATVVGHHVACLLDGRRQRCEIFETVGAALRRVCVRIAPGGRAMMETELDGLQRYAEKLTEDAHRLAASLAGPDCGVSALTDRHTVPIYALPTASDVFVGIATFAPSAGDVVRSADRTTPAASPALVGSASEESWYSDRALAMALRVTSAAMCDDPDTFVFRGLGSGFADDVRGDVDGSSYPIVEFAMPTSVFATLRPTGKLVEGGEAHATLGKFLSRQKTESTEAERMLIRTLVEMSRARSQHDREAASDGAASPPVTPRGEPTDVVAAQGQQSPPTPPTQEKGSKTSRCGIAAPQKRRRLKYTFGVGQSPGGVSDGV